MHEVGGANRCLAIDVNLDLFTLEVYVVRVFERACNLKGGPFPKMTEKDLRGVVVDLFKEG